VYENFPYGKWTPLFCEYEIEISATMGRVDKRLRWHLWN